MRKKLDDNMYKIGPRIRAARRQADLTQEELAERIGVSSQYLSELERGLVGTSIATLINICKGLGVSADYILFGDSKENSAAATVIERIQRLPNYKVDFLEKTLDVLIEAMDVQYRDPENK